MTFNKRNVILLIVSMAVGAALMWWWARQPAKPHVAIHDGDTIDFSSGKPVVKNSAQEKALIDAAVKEMDEAAKSVKFAPTAARAAVQAKKTVPNEPAK